MRNVQEGKQIWSPVKLFLILWYLKLLFKQCYNIQEMCKNHLKADEILKGELYASILLAAGESIKDCASIFKLTRWKMTVFCANELAVLKFSFNGWI